MTHQTYFKKKTWRDANYLAFVRTKKCIVCCRSGSQAHHESQDNKGMGIKSHDYLAIPLCPTCHGKRHSLGPSILGQTNVMMVCMKIMAEYIFKLKGKET